MNFVSVPMLEAGEELSQHREHDEVVIDGEAPLRHGRFTLIDVADPGPGG